MIIENAKGFHRMSIIPFIQYDHFMPSGNSKDYHPCSVGNAPRKEFLHKHEYCEIVLVRKGEFSVMSEDLNTEFHGPCLVIFQKNNPHAQLDYSHTPYERYLIMLNYFIPEQFDPIIKQIQRIATKTITIISLTDMQINWLYGILDHLMHLVHEEKISYMDERFLIPMRCLLEEIRCILQTLTEIELNFCRLNIQYILSYINEHLHERLTIATLASYMHCGKTKLNEDFKKYTGKSVHQYIVDERLALSVKYLKKDYPVGSIATLCGFRDCAHYVKTFQKHFSVTPTQYRKNCDNEIKLTIK